MQFHVAWFRADAADAKAIRSVVTTRERSLEEWPHLVTRAVDGMDVNKLERLLCPKVKGVKSKVGGTLLDKGKMTDSPFSAVSEVNATFVERLAELDGGVADGVSEKWTAALENSKPNEVRQLLHDLAALARQAREAGQPLLQLDVL